MDTRRRPRESAHLITWAIVLGAISFALSAWGAAVAADASVWDSEEGTGETLVLIAWLVAVPALVCAVIGIYRMASNTDRAAILAFELRDPARTGYDYTTLDLAAPAVVVTRAADDGAAPEPAPGPAKPRPTGPDNLL